MTDKNEGIILSSGTIIASQIAVGQGATAKATHIGSGSNVNIRSELTDVQQSAGASDAHIEELQALLQVLKERLRSAPSDKSYEAEAVAAQAAQLIEGATKDKPNRTLLQVLANGLKQTAEFLNDSIPGAVSIAGQIVTLVGRIHGLTP